MIEIHTIWDKIGFGLQNRAVYNIMLLGSEKMSGNISNVKKEVTFDDVYANREIRSLIEELHGTRLETRDERFEDHV